MKKLPWFVTAYGVTADELDVATRDAIERYDDGLERLEGLSRILMSLAEEHPADSEAHEFLTELASNVYRDSVCGGQPRVVVDPEHPVAVHWPATIVDGCDGCVEAYEAEQRFIDAARQHGESQVSIEVDGARIFATATYERDGRDRPFTRIVITRVDGDGETEMGELWPRGSLDAEGVAYEVDRFLDGSRRDVAAKDLVSLSLGVRGEIDFGVVRQTIEVDGRVVEVVAEHDPEGCHPESTRVTVTDLATGDVIAEDVLIGWLAGGLLVTQAHHLLRRPAPSKAGRRWRKLIMGAGKVQAFDAGPTDSTLAAARWVRHQSGRMAAVVVTAYVTGTEERAISQVLWRLVREAQRRGGRALVGQDRICMHDPALPVVHDQMCREIAFDALAQSVEIEIQAVLAEFEQSER